MIVFALYFNYLDQTSVVVTLFIYASLAITFISAGHYLLQTVRLTKSVGEEGRGKV